MDGCLSLDTWLIIVVLNRPALSRSFLFLGVVLCCMLAVFGDRTGAFIGVDFVGDDYDILTCAAVTNVQVL